MLKACDNCGENSFIIKPCKDCRKMVVQCNFCGREVGFLGENFNENLFNLLKECEEKNERQRKIIDDLLKSGYTI